MTSYSQTSSEPRREFRDLLYRQKQLTDQLLGGLDDPNVSSVGLVELIEAIERLDGRKAELAGVFRAEASSLRRREEDRSIRQVILRALEFVGSPQPAWFLQEFVWARDRIDLKTRGFGSLRRDEFRAWNRRPGHRLAYITPALDSEGHALASLMARSDWPLANRLVVEGSKRLFTLKGLESVFRAREELPNPEVRDPYQPLIERCTTESEFGQPPSQSRSEIDCFLALLDKEIQALQSVVVLAQASSNEKLTSLPDEQKLWGKL